MRKTFLPWLACAVIAVVVVPTLAWGEQARDGSPTVDAAFTTRDNAFQDAGGSSPDDNEVTITVGGTVTFTSIDAEGNHGSHNVDFDFETQPSVCNQTDGSNPDIPLDVDGKAPVPGFPQPGDWEGYCTFNTPGTYHFFCQAHSGEMQGTVIVTGTATPTPTATATADADGRHGHAARHCGQVRRPRRATQLLAGRGHAGLGDNSVTITVGQRVTFGYPTGTSVHNVVFNGTLKPTYCPQTKASPLGGGIDSDDAPPLPARTSYRRAGRASASSTRRGRIRSCAESIPR